ncbi:zinc ribbon domain-containing protein [Halodesulfovibrio spirochaetisodalis]|uniref:zinc ribbon domain-containing protein n=1 Tax=Halodesulfovibrio spirochaetisodalis TaxID=1560234 RepID=UPI0009ECE290|nr:zinc ribbon domain-containing protein [Halodesulfovibrio spirochaetisodalis]
MYELDASNIVLLIIWIGFGFWAASIAKSKARSPLLWGILAFLFPIVLFILPFLKPIAPVPGKWKECPACASIIKEDAKVCPHCQRDIDSNP